ncbi:MAG TPA: hypothetical protein ENI87_04805 [bacterium]|nr:hypothetical protein [bacterium]
MLVKPHPNRNPTAPVAALAAIAGFLLAIAITAPWRDDAPTPTSNEQQPGRAAPATPNEAAPTAQLPEPTTERPIPPEPIGVFPLLRIEVAPADWAKVVAHRERSLQQGTIIRDERAIVPATVRVGQQSATGTIRLKGDWTDHILSKQWSLRFELDRPLLGMRRFSIQHPATRHLIMEWLVMQTARRLDLLAPRCDFVHASINDAAPGFYYLEEHPSKEMLESQGRRDGPIVKFDESNMWAIWRQFLAAGVPPEAARAGKMVDAPEVAFAEKRLRRSPALNLRLLRALEQLRSLRDRTAADQDDLDYLRRLHSHRRLLGRTIDEVFDTKKVGLWLALNTMFNGAHGQGWHQLRFYHNPITDRLEPIVFDTGADFIDGPTELAMYVGAGNQFLDSPTVLLTAFEALTQMTAPGWLEKSTTARLDYITAVRQAFAAQPDPFNGFFELPPGFDLSTQFEGKAKAALRHRDLLRQRIAPAAAASFAATTFVGKDQSGLEIPMVEVDAWSCTDIPVRVQAFVFGNGKRLPAAAAVIGLSDVPGSLDDRIRLPDGGVLLPRNGSPLRFRFPADQRLLGLDQIRAIKRMIRQGASPGGPASRIRRLPEIDVTYRPVSAAEQHRERLTMRRQANGTELAAGRPKAPSITAALARHPFLEYDLKHHRLRIPPGRHLVEGDLLLPENLTLVLEPGSELAFADGAVAVVGSLHAVGTAEQPIRIAPRDPAGSFAGVLALGTAGPHTLQFVEVERASGIRRGSWQTTGGVTLIGSRTLLQNCTFRDARGEDAVNVVGVHLQCSDCTFDGGVSDLLDGDFVSGTVRGCTFRNCGSDALDVSGSKLTVSQCRFEGIGDKALSLGEGSVVDAHDCHVHSAMIAACAKDRSRATIRGLTVDSVERFVAVAYIKKPEFGAATLKVTGLSYQGTGEPTFLAQTGCTLEIDGVAIPGEELDVKKLYEQKILGK